MARGAGENVKGIHGSPTGTGRCRTPRPRRSSVLRHEIRLPAQPGRAYLLRADAALRGCRCERAGSFNPCAVVEALEGFEFDGLGNGRRSTGPTITSASRTCWWCAARRTPIRVRPAGDRRGHPDRAGHLPARSPAIRWRHRSGRAITAPDPALTGGCAGRAPCPTGRAAGPPATPFHDRPPSLFNPWVGQWTQSSCRFSTGSTRARPMR